MPITSSQMASVSAPTSTDGILALPSDRSVIEGTDHSTTARNWSKVPRANSVQVSLRKVANSMIQSRKLFVVGTGIFLTFNATLGSSLPSGGTDALAEHFSITDPQQISLPVAVFLVGYIFGPIVFGPLSESSGRWICLVSSFAIYTIFTMACALAPNWPALLFFRFLCGVGASAPQTVLGGVFADIYPNLRHRGRAVTLLALISTVGPLIGPVIAGYTSVQGWQWMFWIALILAALNWPFLWMLPGEFPRRNFS